MAIRRVAVFTGSRAEYGLLYWLLQAIKEDPALDLQLIVGGMHLSHEFGRTVDEIVADGFSIGASIEMLLSSDSAVGIAKSMALGMIGGAEALERLAPDLLVLLGDRYEVLAVAQAAMLARIPIAHLHGGEATEGVIDEAIRHAVTKMSHLHFVAAEPFRRRVIQLGERPDRVFTVGALGVDRIAREELLSREELEDELGFSLGGALMLVTYHPVTLSDESPRRPMASLLRALDRFPDVQEVLTYPNADTYGRTIIDETVKYQEAHPERVLAIPSLGSHRYLSLMALSGVVVGNSSSGLIEAPSLGVPTVNIGQRQRGRLRADSVIDCDEQESAIAAAIDRALDPHFRAAARKVSNPYGDGFAVPRIIDVIRDTALDGVVLKRFHDIEITA